jgi:opacity protein-like surface antigen
MRKALILAGCVLLSISAGDAGAFWVGGHAGSSNGGNLNETSTAAGIQAGGNIDDIFSVEFSGTGFKDSDVAMKLNVTTVSVTGLAGLNVLENVRLYAGAGFDLNIINARVDALEMIASQDHMTVDEFVNSQHITVDEARTAIQNGGLVVNVKFNDNVGYHVEAGAAVNITEGFQVFAQYRYTWAKESGDVTTDIDGVTTTTKNAFDKNYGYGLILVGVNLVM